MAVIEPDVHFEVSVRQATVIWDLEGHSLTQTALEIVPRVGKKPSE